MTKWVVFLVISFTCGTFLLCALKEQRHCISSCYRCTFLRVQCYNVVLIFRGNEWRGKENSRLRAVKKTWLLVRCLLSWWFGVVWMSPSRHDEWKTSFLSTYTGSEMGHGPKSDEWNWIAFHLMSVSLGWASDLEPVQTSNFMLVLYPWRWGCD